MSSDNFQAYSAPNRPRLGGIAPPICFMFGDGASLNKICKNIFFSETTFEVSSMYEMMQFKKLEVESER